MINDIADNNLPDGTTKPDVIATATRVPAVCPDNVDFAPEAKTRDDGNGVRVVADTPEVIRLHV